MALTYGRIVPGYGAQRPKALAAVACPGSSMRDMHAPHGWNPSSRCRRACPGSIRSALGSLAGSVPRSPACVGRMPGAPS